MKTAGLVLAGGAGRRFGGPKAPVVIDGERLVDRAVGVLRAGGCDPVLVVLGAWMGEVSGAVVVPNDQWESGMASSLQAGLAAVAKDPAIARVVITLVDLPGMTAAAVGRVAASSASIAAATYASQLGHPVLFKREHWAEVGRSATGDVGAREFLRDHSAEIERIPVEDVASADDLDVQSRRSIWTLNLDVESG